MIRFALIVPAVVSLSACAPTLVSANSAGGVINMNFNMGEGAALKQANAECAKYGKVAKSQGVNEIRNSLRYECVTP